MAVSVVLCSGGYPADYATRVPIEGVDAADAMADVKVFHSGTAKDGEGRLVTAGGRVLAVTALGDNLEDAGRKAYTAVEQISFEGMHYRRDIAAVD